MLNKGVDPKAPVYKPEGKDAAATKASPWGTKRELWMLPIPYPEIMPS